MFVTSTESCALPIDFTQDGICNIIKVGMLRSERWKGSEQKDHTHSKNSEKIFGFKISLFHSKFLI